MPPVTTHTAVEAYEKVLAFGGCSLVRDLHDARYVADVKNGSYSFEGSAGSSHGLIDSQQDVGGWPEYKTYSLYSDEDGDGIPTDGSRKIIGKKANDRNNEGYTILEVYLNGLVKHLMPGYNQEATQGDNRNSTAKKEKYFVVDKSGKGDFTMLQQAIDAVRAFDPDYVTTIFVKEGTYYEKIVVPDYVRDLKILGENKEKTIISNNDHALINNMGTFRTYTMQIRGDGITLENITIENNAPMVAQAVALHTEATDHPKKLQAPGQSGYPYTEEKTHALFSRLLYRRNHDFIFGPPQHGLKTVIFTVKKTPISLQPVHLPRLSSVISSTNAA